MSSVDNDSGESRAAEQPSGLLFGWQAVRIASELARVACFAAAVV